MQENPEQSAENKRRRRDEGPSSQNAGGEEQQQPASEVPAEAADDMPGEGDDGLGEQPGRKPRTLRIPRAPTAEEVAAHRVGHVHFQPWCKCCVKARARDSHHSARQGMGDEGRIPEYHLDYCFPRDNTGEPPVTVLVGKMWPSLLLRARVVPSKGSSPEGLPEALVDDLRCAGAHGEVMVRSDQENAIGELIRRVAFLRALAKTVIEETPVADSRANGRAERAVQVVEEQCRTIIYDLEEMTGERVSVKSSLFPWIVEYSCDCVNKFRVGDDRRTTYERIKHRKYTGKMLPFGCPVLHRVVGKVQGGNMCERWLDGYYLGKVWQTDEDIVMLSDGQVVKTHAAIARPAGTRVVLAELEKCQGGPMG